MKSRTQVGLTVFFALLMCVISGRMGQAGEEQPSSEQPNATAPESVSEKDKAGSTTTGKTSKPPSAPQKRTSEGEKADQPSSPWSGETMEEVDVPWERMVIGLFFVIILVCVGVYLLKKFGGARFGQGRYMNVLETVPLSGQKTLALVKVGDRAILLATDKENVEKVGEFDADDLPEPEDEKEESKGGFEGVLRGFMKGQQ